MTRSPKRHAWLRILGTSDVHAHLRSFDYGRNQSADGWGLTRLASLVAKSREEAPTSVLLDNGDILQGTPLAQLYGPSSAACAHPVLVAMEAMGYDAIGLGNHEFNYGLDRLEDILAQTDIPVICANVLRHKGECVSEDIPLRKPSVILQRMLNDPETGEARELRIGVLSVVPVQVMKWDGAHLNGRVSIRDMVESAAHHVTELRLSGAEIVVLLAHTGIDAKGDVEGAENAAVALAQIPGVDAMITGHTHRLFPDPEVPGAGINADTGTIHNVPTVMPGFRGTHLGVIDLYLQRDDGAWRVVSHSSDVRRVTGFPEDPEIVRIVEPAHQATLTYVNKPLGRTPRPIHSYLGQVRDDVPTRIVALAQRDEIRPWLDRTEYADLPLLSASAPYQTGGRAGPLAYVDIPAGPLYMRDANTLYPFPNALCAVLTTGAELSDRLERSASAYHQILPACGEQPLLDPAFPGHAIDTIYGLTYRIDLRQPPAYDENGVRLLPKDAPSRIVDMAFAGVPVEPEDRFVLALSGYRAYGGGPYAPFPAGCIAVQTASCGLQSVAEFLRNGGLDRMSRDPCWSFVPIPGAKAVFETGPGVTKYKDELAGLGMAALHETDDAFLRLSMALDHDTCESAA
ncbi:MAG: bifunctional 2',3'-cyclic-nucleotide 2'-phosphodiesterase/3'-nucleotidase [Pseudomonadota bacterium]